MRRSAEKRTWPYREGEARADERREAHAAWARKFYAGVGGLRYPSPRHHAWGMGQRPLATPQTEARRRKVSAQVIRKANTKRGTLRL